MYMLCMSYINPKHVPQRDLLALCCKTSLSPSNSWGIGKGLQNRLLGGGGEAYILGKYTLHIVSADHISHLHMHVCNSYKPNARFVCDL